MCVSRALKSVLVDLSLPKRRALFDFLRDPQFVKSKLTYLFFCGPRRDHGPIGMGGIQR
jgi:hypothetical protein